MSRKQVKSLARIKQQIRESHRVLQYDYEQLRAENTQLQSTLSKVETKGPSKRNAQTNTHYEVEEDFIPQSAIAKPRGFSTPLHGNTPVLNHHHYYGGIQRTYKSNYINTS